MIKRTRTRLIAVAGATAVLVSAFGPVTANAGTLSNTYVRLDRMSATSTSSVRVVFQPVTAGAENKVTVDFPSFTVNATQTISVATCASESGATALPGTFTVAGAGTTVTVSGVTDLTVGTRYCFDLNSTSAVTNPAAGEYYPVVTTRTSADAAIDSVEVAVRTVSSDQISVTAVVPPIFNFVLDGNSDTFTGDLSSGAVTATNGRTVTVNTNAKTGWIAWAKDSDATLGLRSASVAHTIASKAAGTNTTLAAGTEGYLWGVTAITDGTGGGTVSADAAYNATGATHGAGLDGTLRPVASSNGTAENDVITLKARAAISAATPAAADYADTITVVGAGNF